MQAAGTALGQRTNLFNGSRARSTIKTYKGSIAGMETVPKVEQTIVVQSKSPEVDPRSPDTVDRYKMAAEKLIKGKKKV